jgi:hypothetical protein
MKNSPNQQSGNPTPSSPEGVTLLAAAKREVAQAIKAKDVGGRVMALTQSLTQSFKGDPQLPPVLEELRKIESAMVLDGKEEEMNRLATEFASGMP